MGVVPIPREWYGQRQRVEPSVAKQPQGLRGTEPRSVLRDSGSREGALKANRWRRLT